ncbi:Gfo/Idh/MocA family oxidoreductase [Candidatus Poribacteria bacterium]|nr:Gfo/Idh/MocA family oxidoreductase [Candidatus Poribacteria bacterium]
MTILNAAVVGPGGRARAHLPIIRLLSDKYQLVAVCDIDEERAKAVATEMGANAYTDLEEMLNKEKLDVCLVATQAESHHVIARVLAERKVNIVTETPIAVTVPGANLMIKAAKENGVLLEVSENARRWPQERLKRKIVESGLMGDLKEFYLSYTSGSYHGVSAIRAILGTEARSVVGEFPDAENVKERGEIEWSNGIRGKYEYNRAKGNYWEIIGSKGTLRGNELHLFDGDKKLNIVTETVGEGPKSTVKRAYVQTEPEVVWESHLQNYALPGADNVAVADAWCSLYDGVVHGKQLDYGGENAKKDIELLMAIRESASNSGQKITLPLVEITGHEKLIHSEFEKVYGIDILELSLQHLEQKYTLPNRLRELMYYGRILES